MIWNNTQTLAYSSIQIEALNSFEVHNHLKKKKKKTYF